MPARIAPGTFPRAFRRAILTSLMTGLAWTALAAGKEGKSGRLPESIEFIPAAGYYKTNVEVVLSAGQKGARIYYSTNGAQPQVRPDSLYTGPIRIESTTVLRARLDAPGADELATAARTYIFPSKVWEQSAREYPTSWGTYEGKPLPGSYSLDRELSRSEANQRLMERGLVILPAISLTLEPSDLFGVDHGIYLHPMESGSAWERAAVAEFFAAGGGPVFRVNCGVRIQGGWNRRPEESPKHSFRLIFKKKYGISKLRHALFEEGGLETFDNLVLRSGCNNTWLHWSGEERRRGDYIRDQWMRETVAAMGHPSARGLFCHLYLNGIYWGIYNLTERPDASFLAGHFGGSLDDYDSRNADKILQGDKEAWDKLFALANAGVSNPGQFRAVEELLDLPAFIDFMMANLYGANGDWDRASNWYAGRRRSPAGKFLFFVWDGERTLEEVNASILDFDDDQSPARLFQKLRQNPEFRVQFGDRAQKHFFGKGALTPAAGAARFRRWAERLREAMILESARWGGYRRDLHPYKTGPYEFYGVESHWKPEIERLLRDYFPNRTGVLLKQFRAAGLYPAIDPPEVEMEGETIRLRGSREPVYFTIDGTDPRLPGGSVSIRARRYEEPISKGLLKHPLMARSFRKGSGEKSDEWSALVEVAP